MSTKKINIINKLKELYTARKKYFENIYINKENNKKKNYVYWMMKYANYKINLETKKVAARLLIKINL